MKNQAINQSINFFYFALLTKYQNLHQKRANDLLLKLLLQAVETPSGSLTSSIETFGLLKGNKSS